MRSILNAVARRALRRRPNAGMTGSVDFTRWTYEGAILRALRDNEGISLEKVVELVAEEAMRQETARGAWASDIATWGPALFRREAVSAVSRMFGTSLIVEADDQGRFLVAPVAAR
jgi:hypothetical protein